MGRGSFRAKGSDSVYQKWSLASPTDLKKYGGNAGGFLRKFCSCVCYLQT